MAWQSVLGTHLRRGARAGVVVAGPSWVEVGSRAPRRAAKAGRLCSLGTNLRLHVPVFPMRPLFEQFSVSKWGWGWRRRELVI